MTMMMRLLYLILNRHLPFISIYSLQLIPHYCNGHSADPDNRDSIPKYAHTGRAIGSVLVTGSSRF
jgi:hypothetical protein